ncbi:uncharacterized protein LOC144121779 [Amblyomma americanum]
MRRVFASTTRSTSTIEAANQEKKAVTGMRRVFVSRHCGYTAGVKLLSAQNPNSHHGRQQQSGCVRAGGERVGWRSESSDEGGGPFTPVIWALYARMPKMSCKNK